MKYMLEWRIAPEHHKEAVDRFLDEGAPMPDGMTMLGRWHAPGSQRGWLLCECDDPAALAEHAHQWAQLLKIRVTPVTEDDVAGGAAAAVRG